MRQYTVTLSNRTDIRQGWRVSCISMEQHDYNSLARREYESFHRTEAAARKTAKRIAESFNATLLD